RAASGACREQASRSQRTARRRVEDAARAARAARRLGRRRVLLPRGRSALLAPADDRLRDLVRASLDGSARLPPDDVSGKAVPARTQQVEDVALRPPRRDPLRSPAADGAERGDDLELLPPARAEVPPAQMAQLRL